MLFAFILLAFQIFLSLTFYVVEKKLQAYAERIVKWFPSVVTVLSNCYQQAANFFITYLPKWFFFCSILKQILGSQKPSISVLASVRQVLVVLSHGR